MATCSSLADRHPFDERQQTTSLAFSAILKRRNAKSEQVRHQQVKQQFPVAVVQMIVDDISGFRDSEQELMDEAPRSDHKRILSLRDYPRRPRQMRAFIAVASAQSWAHICLNSMIARRSAVPAAFEG